MTKSKPYIVTYEYSDGTVYAKMIPARSKQEAAEFIESKFKDSTAIEVEEVAPDE